MTDKILFEVGDKVLVERWSLYKDDYFTVTKILTEEDMLDIIDVDNYVFTDKKAYILKEICDSIFYDEELILYKR